MISCRGWLPYKRKEEGILKRIPNHKTLFCGRGLYFFFFFTNRGYQILKQHPLSYFFGSMPYKVRQKLPLWTFRGRTLYRYLSRMLLRTLWRRITHYIRNVSWIGLEWARLQDGVLRLLLKKSCYWKNELCLNDWTSRELWESNNRLSNCDYFTGTEIAFWPLKRYEEYHLPFYYRNLPPETLLQTVKTLLLTVNTRSVWKFKFHYRPKLQQT